MNQRQEPDAEPGPEPGPGRWAKPGCVTIRCREDGPLVVEVPTAAADPEPGPAPPEVRVIDHLGNEFSLPQSKRAVALCRCGQSGSRPFCDGSHRETGFRAAEQASSQG